MKTEYIGAYERPEGYNGHIATVHLVLDKSAKDIIEVHPHGFHKSGIVPHNISIGDVAMAKKFIVNHIKTRKFYS